MTQVQASVAGNAAITRLDRLVTLSAEEHDALAKAGRDARRVSARREFVARGDRVIRPTLLLAGWACRVRNLRDGSRQILEFILPGELLGWCHQPEPRVLSSVLALTPLTICPAPPAAPGSSLANAYDVSAARSEAGLLRQITRLGRLNALQRTADLLLELHERLLLSGSAAPTSFALPITQEILADALGLTSVHINRTLKALRQQNLLTLSGGRASLPDLEGLYEAVDGRATNDSEPW